MRTTTTDQLAYSVDQLAAVCGLGRTRAFEEIASGRLVAVKLGRRTVIMREDLEAFLADRRAEAVAAREAAAGTSPP